MVRRWALRLRPGRRAMLAAVAAAAVLGSSLVAGAAGSYDPASDGYSMANIASQIGASAWWDAGYTGAGVDVAVIDTGVSPVPALSSPGSGRLRARISRSTRRRPLFVTSTATGTGPSWRV